MDRPDTIYYPDEDCSRYWKCWNGFTSAHKCPRGLLFNPNLLKCDRPQNVVCKSSTTSAHFIPSGVTEATDVTSQIPLATTSDIPTSINPTESTSTNTPSSNLSTSSIDESANTESLTPTDEYTTTDETDADEDIFTTNADIYTRNRCKISCFQ